MGNLNPLLISADQGEAKLSFFFRQIINNNNYQMVFFLDIINPLFDFIRNFIAMRNMLFCALALSTATQAHEPYVAPLAYLTENTQVPVLSAYAEQAFHPEYALKDTSFTVFQPNQTQSTVQPVKNLDSAATFDLKLPEKGTYTIFAKTSYPIDYVQHNRQWKIFADVAADKVPALSERDYVIPSDFKGKVPSKVSTVREWSIQSYVSKDSTSPVAITPAPIQVSFKTHPNQINVQQPVQLQITQAGKALAHAELMVRAQGELEQQAKSTPVDAQGNATLTFEQAGQYLIEVSEKVDAKAKPKNQYYTIISLQVNASKTP